MDEEAKTEARVAHTFISSVGGIVEVLLDGELDVATAGDLDEAVREVIPSVETCLVVDVEGLSFADSTALALWVSWSHEVPRLEIRNPRPMIRRVIETMGLTSTLHPS